ncbi:putative mitochondrial protein [Vitis vinifera]|uniref:Putative mitochondrial protein n=1 Tax=Vitis vinifera TaxID=29760 RepID=A0A438IU46_VITVI|nr:putative mitochondrial protein [Vitis vinifera]
MERGRRVDPLLMPVPSQKLEISSRRSFWYGQCRKNRSPESSQENLPENFAGGEWFLTMIRLTGKCWEMGRVTGKKHSHRKDSRSAFVQGRQILDAVLIANEIVDERRRSGEEGVVFKIDFEKAYDHVKWDFLDHVLEKKGFSPRWRKWMSGCLSSVSFAILVNGSAKGWVKASRGLRQGDPLSPFLFTLVADVLSRMLMRAEERNMLEGFRVGRNRTRVSHLQFADDTIFFSNSREEELQTLKSLLLVFGHISGLKASGWPILYLGLPLGGNPKACGFWDPVVERISSRLDGWQKAYLSFGGG